MKKTLLTLAAAGTLLASSAFSQRLSPDCERPDQDTIILKFRGEPITAVRSPAKYPLKRMILANCRVAERRLDDINRVVVRATSYTRTSAVWLQGTAANTSVQYLSQDSRRAPGIDTAIFDLPRRGTDGTLQILFQGDLDLKRIRVNLGPAHGRGGNGPGPGDGRGRNGNSYNISCESDDYNPEFCNVPGIISARVVNQLSESACVEGYSFRVLREGISVTKGCRAVFNVQVQSNRR